MLHKHFLSIVLTSLLSISLSACLDTTDTPVDDVTETENASTRMVRINERLFSLPSPIQVSLMARKNAYMFDESLLTPVQNARNYNTAMQKALALGAFGTDLAYLQIYEQFQIADAYFDVVKNLANEVSIINFLDEATINRIERNKSNRDSLLKITSRVFLKADAFLLNDDRNETAVLILTGGWIEGMYIMTNLPQFASKDKELINRVAEQKYALNNIIELLRPYYNQDSDKFDKFLEELVELASLYDGIEIKYTYEKPEVRKKEKLSVIKSTSEAQINNYQIETIQKRIKDIRHKIIN